MTVPSGSAQLLSQINPSAATKLFVVVPAFNEEENLRTVLRELRELRIAGCSVEFIVVDDGSKDGTRATAQELGAPVVSLPYNMGIGIAVQTGFRYALAHGAEWVVQVDGDCQHIPAEIEKLAAPIREGRADVVIGSRFATMDSTSQGIRTTTLMRWLVGRALSINIRLLTGMKISDTTSGFRLFNKKAAHYIADQYPDDYPEVEILVPLACQGFRVLEVPVQMRPRASGESSINWHRAIYYVFKVVMATLFHRVRQ